MMSRYVRKGFVFSVIALFIGVIFLSAFSFQPTSFGLPGNNGETSISNAIKTNRERFGTTVEIESINETPIGITDVPLANPVYNQTDNTVFRGVLKCLMNLGHMSALSAAIIKDNECVWAEGFGLYDKGNQKRADMDTIFLVASISKTVAATAVMQLYEQGCFDLDDDVNDYLPFNLRNPHYPEKQITFRMLLSHSSSLAKDRDDVPNYFDRVIPVGLEFTGYPYPYLKDYLSPSGNIYMPTVWNDCPPGEELDYANIGFALLGYLVEIISGCSFEDYCREYIFDPIGMDDSSFQFTNVNVSRVAVPYDFKSGEYIPIVQYDMLTAAAGGLRTTVLDLSHFLIAHMNGGVYNDTRILNESTVELMHTAHAQSRNYSFQYGLGWQIWNRSEGSRIGHAGGLYGVSTKMVFDPTDDIGIIFFTNKQIYYGREILAFHMIEKMLWWKTNA